MFHIASRKNLPQCQPHAEGLSFMIASIRSSAETSVFTREFSPQTDNGLGRGKFCFLFSFRQTACFSREKRFQKFQLSCKRAPFIFSLTTQLGEVVSLWILLFYARWKRIFRWDEKRRFFASFSCFFGHRFSFGWTHIERRSKWFIGF